MQVYTFTNNLNEVHRPPLHAVLYKEPLDKKPTYRMLKYLENVYY